jgi:hypothetical protein
MNTKRPVGERVLTFCVSPALKWTTGCIAGQAHKPVADRQ